MKKTEIELYGVIVRVVFQEFSRTDTTEPSETTLADRIATRVVAELVAKPALLDTLPPQPNIVGT